MPELVTPKRHPLRSTPGTSDETVPEKAPTRGERGVRVSSLVAGNEQEGVADDVSARVLRRQYGGIGKKVAIE